MAMKKIDVVIIGTGTAAFAAAREVRKVTDNFIIISNGIHGTTCVRSGCMPSKIMIHAAELFHSRRLMDARGITASDKLGVRTDKLLGFVRESRREFLAHTLKTVDEFAFHIIAGRAWFRRPDEIAVNRQVYKAGRVVLATGSTPIIPARLIAEKSDIITSDTLFELKKLPAKLDVLGLSVLGAEMAQAFSRLGCQVTAWHDDPFVSCLTDPQINYCAKKCLSQEIAIHISRDATDALNRHNAAKLEPGKVFVATGRKANLESMGLEALGIIRPGEPIRDFDPETMQLGDLPIFVAGDVKEGRSILNEAADEGLIAGFNAARRARKRFTRRTPMLISYTSPTVALVGESYAQLAGRDIIVGEADFSDQGRAKIMGDNKGMLHIYASRKNGILLGAEMVAPGGEHLAHMLAWLIDGNVTVSEAQHMPFYHPSLEEGICTSLRDAARKGA